MMTVNLWRPVHKGSLRGFATLTLGSGLIVYDVAIHVSPTGTPWASPPAKPQLDQDRRQVTLDGRLQWEAVIGFRDRAVRARWSREIIEALLGAYPDALKDVAAA